MNLELKSKTHFDRILQNNVRYSSDHSRIKSQFYFYFFLVIVVIKESLKLPQCFKTSVCSLSVETNYDFNPKLSSRVLSVMDAGFGVQTELL